MPKIKNKNIFLYHVCLIQHRNWPLRSTILNAHGTNASPDGVWSVHAHILTKPSRAGFAVIRLELIESGAETSVYQAKGCSPTDQPVRPCTEQQSTYSTRSIFVSTRLRNRKQAGMKESTSIQVLMYLFFLYLRCFANT